MPTRPAGRWSTVDVATGHQTVLTRPGDPAGWKPVWAPEGDRIYFIGAGPDTLDVFIGVARRRRRAAGADHPVHQRDLDRLEMTVTGPHPDLTTVIVNWNTVGLLDDCLQSLVDHLPPGVTNEVIVVDNASADGSVEHLAREWPWVKVIANTENVGFCRANNQAIRASTGEILLLINTDARVTPGCIESMLGYFDRDPRAGVVGPRLEYGDGSFQRWTAGRDLTLGSCANYFLMLDRLADRFPSLSGIYLAHDTDEPFQPGMGVERGDGGAAVGLRRRRACSTSRSSSTWTTSTCAPA